MKVEKYYGEYPTQKHGVKNHVLYDAIEKLAPGESVVISDYDGTVRNIRSMVHQYGRRRKLKLSVHKTFDGIVVRYHGPAE